jgi:hypothetical protein
MNPVFTGIVTKNELKFDKPHKFIVHKAKFEGKPFELILRQPKSKRSLQQNAAYWGIVIEILSNHTGFDKDSMHDALKVKFASKIDPDTGLTITESTAKMDTKRFIEYYEQIQRWAAEFLGCYIPNPNEIDYQDGDFR